VTKVLRCTDIAHFYLPCGAPHGYPIGAQDDDYHWHLADDDGNLFASYHAACKPPVPPLAGRPSDTHDPSHPARHAVGGASPGTPRRGAVQESPRF
jgi:hypothetical protein